jgi:hypothetical protein
LLTRCHRNEYWKSISDVCVFKFLLYSF